MKEFIERHFQPITYGLILIVVVLSYLLGVEQGRTYLQYEPVVLSCNEEVLASLEMQRSDITSVIASETAPAAVLGTSSAEYQGAFVGSKNGTKYYTPDCGGLSRIKPENYIWFSDEEDAKLQGYTPASC